MTPPNLPYKRSRPGMGCPPHPTLKTVLQKRGAFCSCFLKRVRSGPLGAQVAAFGDFPGLAVTPDGARVNAIQRIDRQSVTTICHEYRSRNWLSRFFQAPRVYKEHPDVAPGEYADRTAKGVVTNLAASREGLFADIVLTRSGEALLDTGCNTLSACWQAEFVAEESGDLIFRPIKLLSVGLTASPNPPVATFSI